MFDVGSSTFDVSPPSLALRPSVASRACYDLVGDVMRPPSLFASKQWHAMHLPSRSQLLPGNGQVALLDRRVVIYRATASESSEKQC